MDKKELQVRIRQTLKNLESLIDPLKDVIRTHTKKIKENHDKNIVFLGELTTVTAFDLIDRTVVGWLKTSAFSSSCSPSNTSLRRMTIVSTSDPTAPTK